MHSFIQYGWVNSTSIFFWYKLLLILLTRQIFSFVHVFGELYNHSNLTNFFTIYKNVKRITPFLFQWFLRLNFHLQVATCSVIFIIFFDIYHIYSNCLTIYVWNKRVLPLMYACEMGVWMGRDLLLKLFCLFVSMF